MVCKRWSSPDALHWNGLCTNEMRYETDNTKCIVCPYPIRVRRPCATVCSPPLKAPYQFVLDIHKSLELSVYPYPYTYTATLPPDHVGSTVPLVFDMYDKMPTAAQIAAPIVMTATYTSGAEHNCEWLGNMLTSRWYRLTLDPGNGIYYSCEVWDAPEYGQRTAHPFASCRSTGAYPLYECSQQQWGHQWILTMGPRATEATLELRRDVARHFIERYSGGGSSEISPLSSTRGSGAKGILFNGRGGPQVWNVMPNKGYFSYPNSVPQTIGIAPNYATSLASYSYYAPMANWICSDICANRSQWVFTKTSDLSESTTTPGITNDGRPMPVILGLPKTIALSVAA